MFGNKRFLTLALCLIFLVSAAPVFAGDRDVDVNDLKGISPHRHRYIFSVIGGGLVGGGLGALVGGAPNVEKGILLGSGGMSALYLHSHRSTGGANRDWLFIGSHTALGTGLGWTLCGCNKGALFGALAGGGGSAIWRSMAPNRGIRTATASSDTTDANIGHAQARASAEKEAKRAAARANLAALEDSSSVKK
ncbi:MAG TPA: hypothetical protein VE734_08510 [Terriglobales bacterium]|jgi:hypothetical protein|nr:hypothetical protein [Terriglobales bacterium]